MRPIKILLHWLFPPECTVCAREDFWLCPACCRQLIELTTPQQLRSEQLPLVTALTNYHRKLLAPAIRQLKFGHSAEVLHDLQPLLAERLAGLKIPRNALLVPVPLHWQRRFARGFNQSQLLAEAIAAQTGHAIVPLLRRLKNTRPQTLLTTPAERAANLRNAFWVAPQPQPLMADTPIVIVDDVGTTLSTLDACAQALRAAGFTNLQGLVLAHGD